MGNWGNGVRGNGCLLQFHELSRMPIENSQRPSHANRRFRRALWRKHTPLVKSQQGGLYEFFYKLPPKILMRAQAIARQRVGEFMAGHRSPLASLVLNPRAPATSHLF